MRTIELLAPARSAAVGIEAIKHGADAVYIGASKFGARAAAGNSFSEIRDLAAFAHVFNAKVYVTLNTILYDSELAEAERLAYEAYDAGADALIVQDAAFLSMNLPIPLHASTQADNRTPGKVCRLYDDGFDTAVLARELSLDEIERIHAACPEMRLEVFVHGALCVSYSGRCYASQYCFGRSANRGECAQFCRLPFDLEDASGRKLVEQKYLLSLRDMNRSDYLEQLMDAGVSSFKIEGRLKDMGYVKNVTAYYRSRIDEILQRRSEFSRASAGKEEISFRPSPEKSFNRGFTDYFLTGRNRDLSSLSTPKSIGEAVGAVEAVDGHSFTVSGVSDFHNGDGLCFFDSHGKLHGFRVNRAEGNRLFPAVFPTGLVPRTQLYRNSDAAFEHALDKPTAVRMLDMDIELSETPGGYALKLTDALSRTTVYEFPCAHENARTQQSDNLRRQLSRLGGTSFRVRQVTLRLNGERFIPASVLAAARREAVAAHMQKAEKTVRTPLRPRKAVQFSDVRVGSSANVANYLARGFYTSGGAVTVAPAYELEQSRETPLMTCRYCIRHALGACLRERGGRDLPRELFLRLGDGCRFRLAFDCNECVMRVYAP